MTEHNSYWMSEDEYKFVTDHTPIPTVNLVILRGNKKDLEVLLLVRKTGYAKGKWCMIGGRVRISESLEQAIERHAEDLGVKVKIVSPFGPIYPAFIDDRDTQDKTKHPISMIFPVRITSGKIRNEGMEYKGFKWFSLNKLPRIAYGQKLQIEKTIEKIYPKI